MIYWLVLLAVASTPLPADTVFTLGSAQRDLTGDGTPEVLRLVAKGPNLDSLAVTFTIESSGQVLFDLQLFPLTRASGVYAGRRGLTPAQHRARLAEFPEWFFGEGKFLKPPDFVRQWQQQGPRHIALIPDVIARDHRRQIHLDSLVATGLPRPEAERRARVIRGPILRNDSILATEVWQEIQRSEITIFEFSPGGDAIYPIAWSTRNRRFYRLAECC
jgi:hypothetical protein